MGVVQGDAAAPAVDFVSAFATTAAEVVATIPSCDMGARVPACPDWSSYDLVLHLGNIHSWAATIVETGQKAPPLNDEPPSRRARSVARWYAGKAEDLLQVLRTVQGDDPCWTFSEGHRTSGFWPRRQTHETLVHLVDLQQAAPRRATDIPSSLAADGVAEVLGVFLPRMHARGRPATLEAPVLLHATDTGHAWLLDPPAGEAPPGVHRVGGSDLVDADTDLVSGSAADLMLLLWKRLPLDSPAVTLDGDRTRLTAFLRSPLTP